MPFLHRRACERGKLLLCAALALALAGPPGAALAQAPVKPEVGEPTSAEPTPPAAVAEPPPAEPPPPPPQQPEADKPIRFSVEIDGPRTYENMLKERLPLLRWQAAEQVTLPLLKRLVDEARASTVEALAADGYFSADVRGEIVPRADAALVRLTIDPGPRTHVKGVDLRFGGMATQDPEGQERIELVRRHWRLEEGDAFRDETWTAAKREALERLGRGRYAAARIARSEARIFPEELAARLEVDFDSGPIFHAGPVNVAGLKRYPASVVANFNPHALGEPYDATKLELYQRRLLETGYFSAVHFSVEPDVAQAAAAPLNVAVIEAPSQGIDTGLSYSTNLGFGIKVDYRNANLLESAWRFRSLFDVNEKEQRIAVTLDSPPRPRGRWDTYSARLDRSDVQKLISREAVLEYAHSWGLERVPSRAYVSAHHEDRSIADFGDERAHAVFLGYRKTYRTTDDLITPREGLLGTLELGVGLPALSKRAFGRARGLVHWLVPLGDRYDLLLRGELGVVLAGGRTGIPTSLVFRTGGDQTVRGYAFQSLGVPLGDAVVGGRYLAVASAELTRWFTDTLGGAVFVDAGDAADKPKSIDMALGVGTGVRWKSPIGPLRGDIAYGLRSKDIRLHFSVGYSF